MRTSNNRDRVGSRFVSVFARSGRFEHIFMTSISNGDSPPPKRIARTRPSLPRFQREKHCL